MTFVRREAHNPLMAPAVCLCRECARIVLALRCDKWNQAGDMRCGDYKGHRGEHTLLIATTFQIAEAQLTAESTPKEPHG